ncbi:hypothetical protein [Gordonia humi]|uniref:hypothetical protein n=1 Tax=Gordonia humi TaxID=686429 RepID=UPI001614C300|nr:hypothetical protein [Gordonia humi]
MFIGLFFAGVILAVVTLVVAGVVSAAVRTLRGQWSSAQVTILVSAALCAAAVVAVGWPRTWLTALVVAGGSSLVLVVVSVALAFRARSRS